MASPGAVWDEIRQQLLAKRTAADPALRRLCYIRGPEGLLIGLAQELR